MGWNALWLGLREIRRNLLRCLAGPVTGLPLREESDILLLTRPSIALRAHVAHLRLRRAFREVGFAPASSLGPGRNAASYRGAHGLPIDLKFAWAGDDTAEE
jgi:hypothetical protein